MRMRLPDGRSIIVSPGSSLIPRRGRAIWPWPPPVRTKARLAPSRTRPDTPRLAGRRRPREHCSSRRLVCHPIPSGTMRSGGASMPSITSSTRVRWPVPRNSPRGSATSTWPTGTELSWSSGWEGSRRVRRGGPRRSVRFGPRWLAVDRPALRAEEEQELAIVAIAGGRLEECVAHGRRAFEFARSTREGSVTAEAAGALLGFEFIAGHGIREDLLPYLEGDNSETVAEFRPNILFQDYRMALGIVLKWADDFEACRRILGSRYERARQTGDEAALPYLLYQLSELECWAGRWDDAERYTREGLAVLRDGEVEWAESAALYTSALLHACRGNVASARNMAERAIESAVRTNNLPMTVLTHSTIGFLEVSLGEFA